MREKVQVLWCPNRRYRNVNGWSFPRPVERLLRQEFADKRIGHLFGGLARFGVRLDVDPTVRPHVIGDAWLPPFVESAFDVVILDPPYMGINQQMKHALLQQASWVAKEHVVWFHTQWVAADSRLQFERGWLVRVGDACAVRALQVFRVRSKRKAPVLWFTRGPAIRYNRWLTGQTGLPFAG
jgi:hypothetical protein